MTTILTDCRALDSRRGTDTPFEAFGAPWIKPREFAQYLNAREIPGVRFVPTWFTPAKDAKLGGERVGGVQMIVTDRSVLDAPELGLELGSALKLRQGRLIPQQLDQSIQLPIGGIELQHKKFGTYPPALQDLATYEEGWCEGYATEPVFTGKYSGYRFAYDAPPSTLGPRNKFFFSAVPFAPENRGGREFCADQSGAIRVATKGITCTTNSHELREEDDFSRLKLP